MCVSHACKFVCPLMHEGCEMQRVYPFTGLDYWTGLLDWTTGLDYWTGLLDWTTGLDYWTVLLDSSFLLFSCLLSPQKVF